MSMRRNLIFLAVAVSAVGLEAPAQQKRSAPAQGSAGSATTDRKDPTVGNLTTATKGAQFTRRTDWVQAGGFYNPPKPYPQPGDPSSPWVVIVDSLPRAQVRLQGYDESGAPVFSTPKAPVRSEAAVSLPGQHPEHRLVLDQAATQVVDQCLRAGGSLQVKVSVARQEVPARFALARLTTPARR